MVLWKGSSVQVLTIGVGEHTKLKRRLGGGFEVRKHNTSTTLPEVNRDRAADVAVVGEQHGEKLRGQLKTDPTRYRSHMSVGLLTDENPELASIPFDGVVSPPPVEETVYHVKHLARLTELKRRSATLYQLAKILADMEANRPPPERGVVYERLKQCKHEIEADFDQLIDKYGKKMPMHSLTPWKCLAVILMKSLCRLERSRTPYRIWNRSTSKLHSWAPSVSVASEPSTSGGWSLQVCRCCGSSPSGAWIRS